MIEVAKTLAWMFQHADGVDRLVDAGQPQSKSAVRLLFLNEKVRPNYVEAVPASPPVSTSEGVLVAPVVDLVRMKLTSFRLKDRVDVQDLDGVGLITPEIEAQLSKVLHDRLLEIQASE